MAVDVLIGLERGVEEDGSRGAGAAPTRHEEEPSGASRPFLDLLPVGAYRKDRDGRYTYVNRAGCRLLQRTMDELVGRRDEDLFGAPAAERFQRDDERALAARETVETLYEGLRHDAVALAFRRGPLCDRQGRVVGTEGAFWDPAPSRLEGNVLEQEISALRALVDTIPDSVYLKDREGRFMWANRRTVADFGMQSLREVLGRTEGELLGGLADEVSRTEEEILRTGNPFSSTEQRTVPAPEGTAVRWLSTTKNAILDSEGRIVGTFGYARDITEQRRAEEQLARHSLYDGLTRLPNRALFMNRLDHLLRRARRAAGRTLFAVLYLDIDRFKGVNDSLGHHTGDELLVQIARRLEGCVRPGDTLARLGGDEFTLLLEDIRNEADATRVAERIHAALASPFMVGATEFFSSASIGIALSSTGYSRPEEMLRDADIAMYRAKANGRSRHEVFDVEMHKRAVRMLQTETDLRRALERKECRVYYQPIADLRTGRITGFEALLRWQHPQRGLVGPDLFIPIAEETGLIVPIGFWAMREACRQTREWQQRFPDREPLTISVNLSTRQMAVPDMVERVQAVLAESGLDPGSLILEITESSLMNDFNAARLVIKRLHDHAVRFDIDDFGTGYSSLSYLQSFQVDKLKVDRSFVSRMNAERGQWEIVRAVVALAQSLGLGVTAEGVETAEQIATLRALDCRLAQGYFFSPPLPADKAERLIAEGFPPF